MKYKLLFLIFIIALLIPNTYALIPDASMKIFAVGSGDTAMDATLNISVVPGTGKIFSSIDEALVGNATQESVKNAVNVTNLIIGDEIKENYNFTIDIESTAYSIDGPSAGGAMALLMISMFKDNNLGSNISMTGSITIDGFIGDVGGIYQKTKKAAEVGINLFFVPTGNRTQVITEDGEIKQIDLITYAYDNWGMKIIEVSTIQDVIKYAEMEFESIDINAVAEETKVKFIPEKITNSIAINPMKELVSNYIEDAKQEMEIIKNNLNNNDVINDLSILQNMLNVINYADEALENSETYYSNNYLYSAANNVFITLVNITTVNEVINTPSLIAVDSTAFDLKINELESKINLIENRAKLCALDKLEWCVGAKQRMTWARDKLNKLTSHTYQIGSGLDKITDYSYAMAWVNIANDFLDIGITDSELKFVEANYFKELAQEKIIAVENKLIITEPILAQDEDFQRRLNGAKYNFERGWYVTSLYDSASAMAVIVSKEQNADGIFDVVTYEEKYTKLLNRLRSVSMINSETNVWSKMYLDHSMYFYKSFEFYSELDDLKSISNLKTSNSILNISDQILLVENEVLNYYNSADIEILITESTPEEGEVIQTNQVNTNKDSVQDIYVYSKSKKDIYIYIIAIILFILIIAVIIEFEKSRSGSKQKIQKQIAYIDEQLLEGKLSPFTYKEMRTKYLRELHAIKEQEKNKKLVEVKSEHIHHHGLGTHAEKKIVEQQILELEKRHKELSEQTGSSGIKKVKSIVKKIRSKAKPKKEISKKKPVKKLKVKKGL